jgi:hypothetical protein
LVVLEGIVSNYIMHKVSRTSSLINRVDCVISECVEGRDAYLYP